MKKNLLLQFVCFSALLFSYTSNAQTWQSKIHNAGGGLARDVAIVSTGDGYLYHGTASSNTFFKVDEIGNMSRLYQNLNSSLTEITQITEFNGDYLISQTPTKLSRMSPNGTVLWDFQGGGQFSIPQAIQHQLPSFVIDNGNIVFAGIDGLYIIDEATGNSTTQYLYNNNTACSTIKVDANDNYAILGREINGSFFIIQMSKTGTVISTTNLNMNARDMETVNDGYIVVGDNGTNAVVKKIAFDGSETWVQVYNTGAFHSVLAESNNFVISGNNGTDVTLTKINNTGTLLFVKNYSDKIALNTRTKIIHTNSTQGYVIATTTHLLKTGINGNIQAAETDFYSNGAAILDINNIAAIVNPDGALFWDYENPYYKTPKSGNTSSIFASGLWMGGFDDGGNLKMSAKAYAQDSDYEPGFIGSNPTAMSKVWKITKAQVKALRRDFDDNNTLDGTIPNDILNYPAHYNPNAVDLTGTTLSFPEATAPFVDKNLDGIYNVYDGDYPLLYGDMQVVWLMNDDVVHQQSQGQPLKFNIIGMMYANECSGDGLVDNTIFLRFHGKNKSVESVDSFHLGLWTDFDLGCHIDDYIGSIPNLNSFYVYNTGADDAQYCPNSNSYGTTIPIQSATYLNKSMKYMGYYSAGAAYPGMTNPNLTSEYYNYLTGSWRDGISFTSGGSGYGGSTPTNYVFDGNPAIASDWTMGDFYSSGVNALTINSVQLPRSNPGDEFMVELAYITHENIPHPNPNITPIEQRITQMQGFYDNETLNWDVYLGANNTLVVGQHLNLAAAVEGGANNTSYTYLWSTGATTPILNATAPIEYSVTVTNTATGCSKTDAIQVKFATSTAEKATAIDKIAVFPNPVQDLVQINISQLEKQNINVQLVDVTGRVLKVIHNEYSDIIRLDVSDISAGVYYLSFTDEEATKIGVKKIVIID